MKLQSSNFSPGRFHSRQSSTGGFAVIIVLALVAIALLYAGANSRSLNRLSRQLKALEQNQIHRLKFTTTTNSTVQTLRTNTPVAPLPVTVSNPE